MFRFKLCVCSVFLVYLALVVNGNLKPPLYGSTLFINLVRITGKGPILIKSDGKQKNGKEL